MNEGVKINCTQLSVECKVNCSCISVVISMVYVYLQCV
jgi:hypothetical protein